MDDGHWEDFGQKVDLTARIREILINYPEGTSILKELIQNADDAGARVVRFCLDRRQHPTESLVHDTLAGFQGPALYVYNDATFKEVDFESISNIGDSGKAKDAKKTGRFGVGFNSCYHMTDLPSFVSGEHIVMFDPHCRYLPNVSAANPGKKINFIRSAVADKHPDQFSPFKAFGSDMSSRYEGTLFRFPLRSSEQASQSRISKQVYEPGRILELFEALESEASSMLLFLKSVESLEALTWEPGQPGPTPLHSCAVRSPGPELRTQRRLFLDVAAQGDRHGVPTAGLHQLDLLSTRATRVIGEVVGADGPTEDGSSSLSFLVAQECGGGEAAAMARDSAKFFNTPLVPWVGVAAPLGPGPLQDLEKAGRAFCFLPLPVQTGLPVHINGFFELSTNRRDIWYGEDLTGNGKLRSDWNALLVQKVAAPCYVRVLLEALRLLGPTEAFFRLWPSDDVAEPWAGCVRCVFRDLLGHKVVWVRHHQGGAGGSRVSGGGGEVGGGWVKPELAVFPHGQPAEDEDLMEVLRCLGMPVAAMPDRILEHLQRLSLAPQGLEPRRTTPEVVRRWLLSRPGPCASALGDGGHGEGGGGGDGEGGGREGGAASRLLLFCLSDVHLRRQESVQALAGLRCVPMADGTLGSLSRPSSSAAPLYLASPEEQELLTSSCAGDEGLLGSMVVDGAAVRGVPGLGAALEALAGTSWLNLRRLTASDLAESLLPALLPEVPRSSRSTPWQQRPLPPLVGSDDDEDSEAPTEAWMALLWRCLASFPSLRPFEDSRLPVVPTSGGHLHTLAPVPATALLRSPPGGWGEQPSAVLELLGCHLLPSDSPAAAHQEVQKRYSQAATVPGALDALLAACGGKLLELEAVAEGTAQAGQAAAKGAHPSGGPPSSPGLQSADRHMLRRMLLSPAAWSGVSRLPRAQSQLLRVLPVYCSAPSCPGGRLDDCSRFVNLTSGEKFLPPENVPAQLLTEEFVLLDDAEQQALANRLLGLQRIPRATFYRRCVIERAGTLEASQRDPALLQMLAELPQLQGEDRGLAETLRGTAFVPTASGTLCAPSQLYDPRVPELLELLDSELYFPTEPFTDEATLSALSALGLRSRVEQDTILQAAKHVEALKDTKPEEAVERGSVLLAYLDTEWKRIQQASRAPGKHFGKMISKVFKQGDAAGWSAGGADEFWQQLSMLCWCPVMTSSPVEGLPWPSKEEHVAPPRMCRLEKDIWFVSASLRIVSGEVRSGVLTEGLGWSAPLGGSVLAQQLLELGELHGAVDDTTMCQRLASAVPTLYSALSALDGAQMEVAAAILGEARCVWVGNGFQKPAKVAFSGPLNLAPWLYVIPIDLAPFKQLLVHVGVCAEFTASQYRMLLAEMAETAAEKPLGPGQLAQVVSVIQGLADRPGADRAGEAVHVPDASSILRPGTELVFNDAPWLEGRPDLVFVHPRISHEVAQAMGVASLRSLLLAQSADSMDLSMHSVQAFGQSEALTTRLRHIVEAYADGPGILMELLQNADDAGASSVSLMLDAGSYATDSILSPRMAPWQGPALLAFNDAVFSPQDFGAISRIGQDSKLQRPAATGRFGLGFNAVYHLTDVPSFVSGDFLVMFDPHAKYLPGISPAQPGLKIAFQKANLLRQFPDAFEPYLHFGCSLRENFKGTLFRFPLRTDEIESDITTAAYPVEKVEELLEAFRHQATKALLFLKSVQNISVHLRREGNTELLYEVNLSPPAGKQNPQAAMAAFVKGGVETSEAQLQNFQRNLADLREDSMPFRCEVMVATSRGAGDAPGTCSSSEQWLVCNGLGGGSARRLAMHKAASGGGTRLVPWVGCAARLGGSAEEVPEGQAFCFLPLPIRTGLPLHVNGYFELSSNRRDIWHGDDLAGDGKLRADWNVALLEDAVAPTYARLLSEAAAAMGPSEEFYALWPGDEAVPEPWTRVVRSLFRLLASAPVAWVEGAPGDGTEGAAGARWCAPSETFLVDPSSPPPSAVLEALVRDGMPICTLLPPRASALLLKHAPRQGLLRTVSPATVRAHFSAPGVIHPALVSLPSLQQNGAAAPQEGQPEQAEHSSSGESEAPNKDAALLLEYCISDLGGDATEAAAMALSGLPLLPLQDGSLGTLEFRGGGGAGADLVRKLGSTFGRGGQQQRAPLYFLASDLEAKLLEGTEVVPRIVDSGLLGKAAQLLEVLAERFPALNVSKIAAKELSEVVLPALMPLSWKGQEQVRWEGASGAREQQQQSEEPQAQDAQGDPIMLPGLHLGPSSAQLELLWERLSLEDDLWAVSEWPLLPVWPSGLRRLEGSGSVVSQGGWTEAVASALSKCGCNLLDQRVAVEHSCLEDFVHPGTAAGVLTALAAQVSGAPEILQEMFLRTGVTPEERHQLRAFLMQHKWFTEESLGPWERSVLRSLPIFASAVASEDEMSRAQQLVTDGAFVSLASEQRYLPPKGVKPELLTPEFLRAAGATEEELLRTHLGVPLLDLPAFYQSHLFPRMAALGATVQAGATSAILEQLPSLRETAPAFAASIRNTAFVPANDGSLRSPSALFDPRNETFRSLLDLGSCFPSEAVCGSSSRALEALEELGLQTALTTLALRRSAEVIAETPNGTAEDEGRAKKAVALLKELQKVAEAEEEEEKGDEGGLHEGAPPPQQQQQQQQSDASFWASMLNLEWCPSLAEAPHPGLPWPPRQVPVVPPRLCRPLEDAWLVSASMRVVGEPVSEALKRKLGWMAPPPANVLAAQLLELGRVYPPGKADDPELAAILLKASERLYSLLSGYLGEPEEDIIRAVLEGANAVWVGTGFASTAECALEAPRDKDFAPMLHVVPAWIAESSRFEGLLRLLGVPDSFEEPSFRAALAKRAAQMPAQLGEAELAVAVSMVNAAADLLLDAADEDDNDEHNDEEGIGGPRTHSGGGVPRRPLESHHPEVEMYVPDADGFLARPDELYFNDATWLGTEAAEVRMLHPGIAQAAADALGVRSLRHFHQAQQSKTHQLPCPPAALLNKLLGKQADPPAYALFDIVEFADACGAESVDVHLDLRHHGRQSLLHPGLAQFQGPAICVAIPGLRLSADELCQLQSPSSPYRLRGRTCHYGCGLLASYLLTDLLMAISGDSLYLWDPAGCYLAPRGTSSSTGKQYQISGSDLPSRFSDQFDPWGFAGGTVERGYNGTLLRLPLRTEEQAKKSRLWPRAAAGAAAEAALDAFWKPAARGLLFLSSVKRIRVMRWEEEGGESSQSPRPVHQAQIQWATQDGTGPMASTGAGSSSDSPSNKTRSGMFGKLVNHITARGGATKARVAEADMIIQDFNAAGSGKSPKAEVTQESWLVAACSGSSSSGSSSQMPSFDASSSSSASMRRFASLQLVQRAGVAICLSPPTDGSSSCFTAASGLFAPLPLLDPATTVPTSGTATASAPPARASTPAAASSSTAAATSSTAAAATELDNNGSNGNGNGAHNDTTVVAVDETDSNGAANGPGNGTPGSGPPGLSGLPFLVCGHFSLARSGGRHPFSLGQMAGMDDQGDGASAATHPTGMHPDILRALFNKELLGNVAGSWLEAFEKLRERLRGDFSEKAGDLYALLPCAALNDAHEQQQQQQHGPVASLATASSTPAAPVAPSAATASSSNSDVVILCRALYHAAAEKQMWRLHSGKIAKITEGYFLQPLGVSGGSGGEPGEAARGWIMRQVPLFDVPRQVKLEMDSAGVRGCSDLTPAGVRPLLKSALRPRTSAQPPSSSSSSSSSQGNSNQQRHPQPLTVQEATELLRYCTSDLVLPAAPAPLPSSLPQDQQQQQQQERGQQQGSSSGHGATGAAAGAAASAAAAVPSISGNDLGNRMRAAFSEALSAENPEAQWQALVSTAASGLQGLVSSVREVVATNSSSSSAADAPHSSSGGAEGANGGAHSAPPPELLVDSAALQDCMGLPVPTADGKVVPLGSKQLMIWPPSWEVEPVSLASNAALLRIFVHPTAVRSMGELLQARRVQEKLGLANFTMEHLAGMLPAALPPPWAPHAARAVGPAVPWAPPLVMQPGGPGEPSVAWLRSLWGLAEDLAERRREMNPHLSGPGAAWEPLAGWPLVPVSGGRLLRLSHRGALLPAALPAEAHRGPAAAELQPPQEGNREDLRPQEDEAVPAVLTEEDVKARDAAKAAAESGIWGREPWLQPLLVRLGCPAVDPRFADLIAPSSDNGGGGAEGEEEDDPREALLRTIGKVLMAAELGMLRPLKISEDDADRLFGLLCRVTPTGIGEDGIHLLRSLPIFKTYNLGRRPLVPFDGGFVCCPPDVLSEVTRGCELPEALTARWVAFEEGSAETLVCLGVPVLSGAALLSDFLLPSFADLSPEAQDAVKSHVRTRWSLLRTISTVEEALRNAAFLHRDDPEGHEELCRPSDLLDPANDILAGVFSHRPQMFPAKEFCRSDWLGILRAVGLRSEINAELLGECAAEVEALGNRTVNAGATGPEADRVWSTAKKLTEHAVKHPTLLHTPGAAASVSAVRFVPSHVGIPFGGGGNEKKRSRRLVSFSHAALSKDWALVWSCVPLVDDSCVPPPSFRSALGLRSPPPFERVAEHLEAVGSDGGDQSLASWPNEAGPVEEVFGKVLSYLSDQGLSEPQAQRLSAASFVPVANATRLARPSLLFSRLRVNLSPFAFEIPAAFIPHAQMLQQMGARGDPSTRDLLRLMASAAGLLGGRALNANERNAMVRLLECVEQATPPGGQEERQVRNAARQGEVFLPDCSGRLVPSTSCIHCGKGVRTRRLLARIDPDKVRLVHPMVPDRMCSMLSVASLEAVAAEELDQSTPLRQLQEIQGTRVEDVRALLAGADFAEAVAEICSSIPPVVKVLQQELPSSSSRGGGGDQARARPAPGMRLAQLVHGRLGFSSVCFVERCSTRVVLVGSKADITLHGGLESVPLYVCRESNAMYIAEPKSGVPVTALLSQGVSSMLGSPFPLPLDSFFACAGGGPGGLSSLRSALLPGGSQQQGALSQLEGAKRTGELGAPLAPADRHLVQLKPLRPYFAGEMVAYRAQQEPGGDPSGSSVIGADEATPPLKYGRVAADSRAAPGQGLHQVLVEVEAGRHRDILSSNIYSFRDSRHRAEEPAHEAQAPSTGASPAPPLTLLHEQPTAAPGSSSSSSAAPSGPNAADEEGGGSSSSNGGSGSGGGIPAKALVGAVQEMLGAVGMPLDLERSKLLQGNLEMQKQVTELQSKLAAAESLAEGAQSEAEKAKSSWQCRICLTSDVDTAFQACGHLLCGRCASSVSNRCPFCRKVSSLVKVFK